MQKAGSLSSCAAPAEAVDELIVCDTPRASAERFLLASFASQEHRRGSLEQVCFKFLSLRQQIVLRCIRLYESTAKTTFYPTWNPSTDKAASAIALFESATSC